LLPQPDGDGLSFPEFCGTGHVTAACGEANPQWSPERHRHAPDGHSTKRPEGDPSSLVVRLPPIYTWTPGGCGSQTAFPNDETDWQMTDVSLDELGPVDYVVVEFPAGASHFTGEMVDELVSLVEAGTIRVIDVLILTKDADGGIEAMELSDVGELGPLEVIETQLAELLAEEDVVHLAAAMEPGSTAGVLIWENLWAAPFASAARRSGGQLIANGRIPIQAIIASIEADEDNETEGD